MNFIGKVTRFFKKTSVAQRSFSGARGGRLNSDWQVSNLSLNSLIKGSLKLLRMRSRDLEINNEYIRAHLRTREINIIGRGIPFQGQAKDKSGEISLKVTNRNLENEFYEWSKKDSCDVAGLLSFQDIEKLAARRTDADGEFIVRIVRKRFGESRVPFALQILDPDLLDENFNGFFNGNQVRLGVELNEWGRPVAYHFLTNHPGDAGFGNYQPAERVRIEKKDIVHLYLSERANQLRGYPQTNSVMKTLHQLAGFEEAVIVGKRVRASIMGAITTADGEAHGDGVSGDERVTDMAPGKVLSLREGEKYEVPNFGGDSGADTEPFIWGFIKKVAAALGSAPESISGDFTKGSYSSMRQSMVVEREGWRVAQDWIIRNFHQPIYEQWLQMALLAGVVSMDEYFANPSSFKNVDWKRRGWPWVDPQKDVMANVMAIEKGLKTYSDVLAEDGQDFEEIVLRRKKEKEFMEQNGVYPTPTGVSVVQNTEEGDRNENQKK